MNSCLYRGWVRHRRHEPRGHRFRYRVFQVYLDLDELDRVFAGRWLWSTRRPAPAWFRRADHLGDPGRPLADCVRDLVEERCGWRPRGPIRLLTHLRYLGFVMNPVSFYYCWDAAGEDLEAVVAEVHNTPWGERHCYVLDASRAGDRTTRRWRFAKEFHVSPFMPMDVDYAWSFDVPGERLTVHMENHREGRRGFDATMHLERRSLSGSNLARVLARHPCMTAKVFLGIYWQALRLRMKRVPFHEHPRHAGSRPEEMTIR